MEDVHPRAVSERTPRRAMDGEGSGLGARVAGRWAPFVGRYTHTQRRARAEYTDGPGLDSDGGCQGRTPLGGGCSYLSRFLQKPVLQKLTRFCRN